MNRIRRVENHPMPAEPPENSLFCGFCGFTAPKAKYKIKHVHCWTGLLVAVALLVLPTSLIIYFIFTVFVEKGVVMGYEEGLMLTGLCGLGIGALVFISQGAWEWAQRKIEDRKKINE